MSRVRVCLPIENVQPDARRPHGRPDRRVHNTITTTTTTTTTNDNDNSKQIIIRRVIIIVIAIHMGPPGGRTDGRIVVHNKTHAT